MATSEAGLVGSISRAIIKAYPASWVVKIHGNPYQESGLPDLFVVVDGRFIGIEVKNVRPNESTEYARARVTPRQHYQINRIRAAGASAGVVVSVAEAFELIEQALREKE